MCCTVSTGYRKVFFIVKCTISSTRTTTHICKHPLISNIINGSDNCSLMCVYISLVVRPLGIVAYRDRIDKCGRTVLVGQVRQGLFIVRGGA